MSAPTVHAKAGETWPVTHDGWTALIGEMQRRAPLVFPGHVADLVRDRLRLAHRLLGMIETGKSGQMDRPDIEALTRVWGPLLAEVRDQPERTAPTGGGS